MPRHLMCHFYPHRAAAKWQRTVDHLLQRVDQFDGRRLIAIACDENTVSPTAVMEALGYHRRFEYYVVRNEPSLQELMTFRHHLDQVVHEPGITFRCHSKGCTHADGGNPASHAWADVMFSACLDWPEIIECAMRKYTVCGALRSHGIWGGQGYHSWHYAGSCYWFNNEVVRTRDYQNLQCAFWGPEAWPGMFPLHESLCLFADGVHTQHLYHIDTWTTQLGPRYRSWCDRMRRLTPRRRPYVPSDSRVSMYFEQSPGIIASLRQLLPRRTQCEPRREAASPS